MIATCPACGKRYRLADDAVPAAGRSVRCAACGHGWTVVPGGPETPLPGWPDAAWAVAPAAATAAAPPTPVPPPVAPLLPFEVPTAAAPAAPFSASAPATPLAAVSPRAAAAVSPRAAVAGSAAGFAPATVPDTAAPDTADPPPRRRWGWLIATLFVVVALAGLAVVEFAPASTFDPPRLGLPAARLPLADLGSLGVPSLPPLDLTRVPVVGARLDALVNPPPAPASPLRVTARGERRRLANGTWLLSVTGSVTNPTATPVALSAIDAALVDPGGHVAFHWRIAAPASIIGPRATATFESTAANFPAEATILHLRPR